LHYTTDGDDGDHGGGVEQHRTKEYEHYSQILCSVSCMIDTTLSVDMMERTTRIVHLHGVPPAVFERALQYVLDPLYYSPHYSPTKMTSKMAERLLPFYDMYDFPSGRMLCDAAIAREFTLPTMKDAADNGTGFLQHWTRWFTKKGNTLHRLLTITVLADEMRLPTAGPMTIHYVTLHLHRFPGYYHADHMQTLHPLLQKGFFLDLVQPATFTPDEIASNLFPKLFLASLPVQLCPSCYARHLRSNETSIRISGAGTDRVNGLYQRTESALFSDRSYRRTLPDGGEVNLTCCETTGEWTLWEEDGGSGRSGGGVEERTYYTVVPIPYSTRCENCRAFPPTTGQRGHWSVGKTGSCPFQRYVSWTTMMEAPGGGSRHEV
jgi:hypothetical protein